MQIDTIALIIAVASFIGVIIGPVATNLITARQATVERKEAKRREKQERLMIAMQSLIKLRSKLQYLQGIVEGRGMEPREREEAYGEAYGIILSIT